MTFITFFQVLIGEGWVINDDSFEKSLYGDHLAFGSSKMFG